MSWSVAVRPLSGVWRCFMVTILRLAWLPVQHISILAWITVQVALDTGRAQRLLELCMANAKRKPPWKRAAPKKAGHVHLSAKQKTAAKRRAKRAGRNYPNLVDNMREARKKK